MRRLGRTRRYCLFDKISPDAASETDLNNKKFFRAATKYKSDVNIVLRHYNNEKSKHWIVRGCRDLLRQCSARAGSSWRRRLGRRWLVGTRDRRWGHRRCAGCSILCRSRSVLRADLCTGTDLWVVVVV